MLQPPFDILFHEFLNETLLRMMKNGFTGSAMLIP